MSASKPESIIEALDKFQANALLKSEDEIVKETIELDSKYGHEATYVHNIDGVLINIGTIKKSLRLIYLAQKRLLKILRTTKEDFPFYNMGNALMAIREIKYGNAIEELLRIHEPREAREYFISVPPGRSFAQAYTNLGNILERYGRNYEAIQIYDMVLKKQPTFGMALGNKAKALLYYYNLVSDKNPELLFHVIELLEKAIGEDSTIEAGGQEALDNFKRELNTINCFLIQNHIRRPSPKKSLNSISKYQRFCKEKNLFLNFCFNCFHCKRGFADSFQFHFIDKLGADSKESSYRYSSYSKKTYYSIKTLNQIYEDYAAARYIYFHATTGTFRNYDRITRYNSALDYCRNSIQYGFIKTTYIRLFNILDKIAHLVYTNYELEQKDIYFTDLKSSKIENLIIEKNSWNLLALHSMAWDFLEKQVFHHLSQIRNRITHEFIDISLFEHDIEDAEDQYHIDHHLSEKLLRAYTEDLFLLVKSALMYFMNTLYQDYKVRKNRYGEPFTLPIYPQIRFYK